MQFIRALAIRLLPLACGAQQVVAPTPEAVGPVRGNTWADYNVTTSFETGYRFNTVAGNTAEYRSSVNFGNGVRLLGSSFTMNSKDGHGKYFDDLSLTTEGLGGDPYESASLRIQKNRIYRYDMLWRRNDYFNPGLVTGGANGSHLLDTSFTSQDHDLTLFPQSNVRFFLGYTRDRQTGAGISTVPAFDPTNNFPVFANVEWLRNEYRVGNEIRFHGLVFNWIHGWEDFKDDTARQINGPVAGAGALSSFRRAEPYHGTSPYWRLALFYERHLFNINGRFTYTSGRRAYILAENAAGTGITGVPAIRQILSFGNASRPVATGNLNISVLPSSKLTITNQTSTYNVRTEGDSTFVDLVNATGAGTSLSFESLGILTVANQTDIDYRAKRWLGFYAGYDYSRRRIRSVQQFDTLGLRHDQTNMLNAGLAGLRLNLAKGLALSMEGEIGRASVPFAPKSDERYHALTGRLRYKFKTLQLMAWTNATYNVTSVTLSAFSSHTRSYSASASWSPLSWFAFDASYAKLHLDTIGGIAYFAGTQFIQGDRSYYVSNIHSGNLGVRLVLKKRATVYAGYSIVQDVGDGRGNPLGDRIAASLPAFQAAQTFPLRFQSPLARVSIRLAEKLRWNFGYQYYGYRQDFFPGQNYRANTGYTSLQWSF